MRCTKMVFPPWITFSLRWASLQTRDPETGRDHPKSQRMRGAGQERGRCDAKAWHGGKGTGCQASASVLGPSPAVSMFCDFWQTPCFISLALTLALRNMRIQMLCVYSGLVTMLSYSFGDAQRIP